MKIFMALQKTLFILAVFVVSSLLVNTSWAADEATEKLNVIRLQNNASALAVDPTLQQMAQYQANLMAEKNKVSHSVGWGNSFVARLRKFAIRGAAGENVAAGQKDISAVYLAWMNSPNHRKNMVDPAFHHYGLAKATNPQKPNYHYWAIVFGL